jgi:hypothetical protein
MRDFRLFGIESVGLADHLAITEFPGEDVEAFGTKW